MAMHFYKNLVINSCGSQTAILWTHGGYTPRQGLKPGSGTADVPDGLTVRFHTPDDTVGAGDKARRWLEGNPNNTTDLTVFQTAVAGQSVKNYSLSVKASDNKSFEADYRPQYDMITTAVDKKAHLKDVFDAMRELSFRWTELRYFACRINKVTYAGEVSGPAMDPDLFRRIHGRDPE